MEPCCAVPQNRVLVETRSEVHGREPLTVQQCTVCRRRHYELVLAPGRFQVRLQEPPAETQAPAGERHA